MGRAMVVLVMFVVALGLRAKAAMAVDCTSVGTDIQECSEFLSDPKLSMPGSSCCNTMSHLLGLGDVHTLCACLSPFTFGVLPSKAQMIPHLCNLPAFSPLVPCLSPPRAKSDSLLPPTFALPPFVFTLPPFIPIPIPIPHPPPTA